MTYQHLFGPVASRRLGVSLGVDLVVHKVCTLNCVYCECGKTTELTCQRRSWVSLNRVCAELDHYWAHHDDPDFITFSGSGEPTLNKDIGAVIAHIKQQKPDIRVAVLTNATLLSDPGVQSDLARADLVVPSLDAVSEKAFHTMNRPCPGITPEQVIQGIETFVRKFKGRVALEMFILPGVNDTPGELALLNQAADRIAPDMIQLNTLDRPGTEGGLTPADRDSLERIRQLLGPERTQIIARLPRADRASRKAENLEAAVLETIFRRPCTCKDLAAMLGADASTVQALVDRLEAEGKVQVDEGDRGRFYQTRKGEDPWGDQKP
jgi:wyosine [tRNA(Phe)-imidazoG37] synthetase (radical SAM superfamily)